MNIIYKIAALYNLIIRCSNFTSDTLWELFVDNENPGNRIP